MQNIRRNGSASLLIPFSCGNERAQIAISSFLDGEADPAEQALAEWHLAECRGCQRLMSGWSQDRSRLSMAALHNLPFNRLAGAIADQTRDWLSIQLGTPRRPAPKPAYAPRLAMGAMLASLTMVLSIMGLGLSTLNTPASTPVTVGVTVGNSPLPLFNASSPLAATPSVGRANFDSRLNSGFQAEKFQNSSTPVLNYLRLISPMTPVGQAHLRMIEQSNY